MIRCYWRLRCGTHCRCVVVGRQALSTRVPAGRDEMSTLFESFSASRTGSSSRKMERSFGASWRLRCSKYYRCLRLPPLRTFKQPQACSIRKKEPHVVGSGAAHIASACTQGLAHQRAAARLLHQSELHGGSVATHNQCRCVVVGWQALSTTRVPAGRAKHALRVRLRLSHRL